MASTSAVFIDLPDPQPGSRVGISAYTHTGGSCGFEANADDLRALFAATGVSHLLGAHRDSAVSSDRFLKLLDQARRAVRAAGKDVRDLAADIQNLAAGYATTIQFHFR